MEALSVHGVVPRDEEVAIKYLISAWKDCSSCQLTEGEIPRTSIMAAMCCWDNRSYKLLLPNPDDRIEFARLLDVMVNRYTALIAQHPPTEQFMAKLTANAVAF